MSPWRQAQTEGQVSIMMRTPPSPLPAAVEGRGGLDLSVRPLGGSFVWQQRFAWLRSPLRESVRRGEESLAV